MATRKSAQEKRIVKLTWKELLRALHYDPITGLWLWRITLSNRAKAGSPAGTIAASHRHRAINVYGGRYLASRLAWLYMKGVWPDRTVDHENCDSLDDRWCNLRLATQAQQQSNRPTYATSGYKGVCAVNGGFMAQITIDKKRKYLGFRKTAEDAHQLYCRAAVAAFGEFARLE